MSDNVTSPVAAGTVLAADDVGGVLYPRSKVVFGVDGSATDVSSTAPLPVQTQSGLGLDTSLQQILAKLIAAPATDAKSEAIRALLAGTLNVNVTGAPSALAQDATLQSILSAIVNDRDETIWTDDSGSYFVRVDKNNTITWTDLSGNTVAAPGTGSRPAAGSNALLDRSMFVATAAGTGFSIGDYLSHLVTTNPSSGAVIGNFWVNATTGAKIAAPSNASITPVSPLPSNAAQQNTLALVLSTLQGLLTVDTVVKAAPNTRSGILGFTGAVVTTSTTAGQFTLTTAPTSGAIVADPTFGSIINAGPYLVNVRVTGLVNGTANTAGAVYQTTGTNTTSATAVSMTSVGPTQVAGPNATRRGTAFQSVGGTMYVDSLRAPASDGQSLTIGVGQLYESPIHHTGVGAIYALGSTPAQAFYGREF